MPRIDTEVFHGNAWNDTEGLPRNNTEGLGVIQWRKIMHRRDFFCGINGA